MPQSLKKKQGNEPVYTGENFPAKGFRVQVTGKTPLTPHT
jgi:hypothetical protein